jgi:hypothetical protein
MVVAGKATGFTAVTVLATSGEIDASATAGVSTDSWIRAAEAMLFLATRPSVFRADFGLPKTF